jgi:hypothetical protein
MPITLTTLPAGATIDADVLRGYIADIERYVNEQIQSNDRTTNWLNSVHVFRPDFQYAGASKETPMPGAHLWWEKREDGRNVAAYHNQWLGTDPVPVVGLCRTIELPENINSTGYYVYVRASFTAFEFGGYGAAAYPSDGDGADLAATFRLGIGTQQLSATNRFLYRCSNDTAATPYDGLFSMRKQFTMTYADDGTYAGTGGTTNVGVYCKCEGLGATTHFKHILITNGNLVVRCRLR